MNLIFTNPWGALALIGLPALVLIYFLQRRAKIIPISTLFLLEKTQRESSAGRRFENFANSIPFWLQLIAILGLTWLLLLPRYTSSQSTQRIAIVLDSSASMMVSRQRALDALTTELPSLTGSASRAEYFVIDHDPSQPRYYQGDKIEDLLSSLEKWKPTDSALDPSDSLRIARTLAGTEGIVIYVTDSKGDALPLSAQRLAVGKSEANCGFTGVSFESRDNVIIWTALIRNFSDSSQTRSWSLVTPDGRSTSAETVNIKSGAIATIQGRFPEGSERCSLKLSTDAFTLDDVLPLIIPQPKSLDIFSSVTPKFQSLANRITNGFENLSPSINSTEADLHIVSYDPLLPILPESNAIVLIDESATGRKYLAGGIFAESHPLTDGLNWQPLAVRDSIQIEVRTSDRVLLWQDKRPLLLLRDTLTPATESDPEQSYTQLIFNFDITRSNALKLPATAVLLHRFCELLRNEKQSYQALNLETSEPIDLPKLPTKASFTALDNQTVQTLTLQAARAHSQPGYLSVSHNGEPLLDAAIHFADTREADLRDCSEENQITVSGSAINLHTHSDRHWRVWLLLILALLTLAWYLGRARISPLTSTA